MTLLVKCPTCKKELEYDIKNKFRPFCSERCKMIDLGAWSSDEYSLESQPENEEEMEELFKVMIGGNQQED